MPDYRFFVIISYIIIFLFPLLFQKCDYCKQIFASKYNLMRHMKLHRPRITKFKCSRCGKTCLNKYNYETHCNRAHRQIVPHRLVNVKNQPRPGIALVSRELDENNKIENIANNFSPFFLDCWTCRFQPFERLRPWTEWTYKRTYTFSPLCLPIHSK